MDINFYIPPSQKIPTELRLKVTDDNNKVYDVCYFRSYETFSYTFWFLNFQFEDENGFVYQNLMDEIIKEIIEKLIGQSEDHGSRWVQTDQKITHQDKFITLYKIDFRIGDAW